MMDGETGTLVTERWAGRWDGGTAVTSSVQGSVGLVFPSQSAKDPTVLIGKDILCRCRGKMNSKSQDRRGMKKGLSTRVTGCPSLEKDRMMDGV